MTKFPDSDLKWLKDPQNKNKNIEVGCVFLDALLARLEAAENLIDVPDTEYEHRYEAWRKACGI